jgi:hypothetical protein
MKLFVMLFFSVGLLFGQVKVSLSPVPQPIARRILNGRAAKVAMPWVVSLTNTGTEPIIVTESAILRGIPQLDPIDHASMFPLVNEANKNNVWARAANVIQDVVVGANFAAATGRLHGSWPEAMGYAVEFAPYVLGRLHANENLVVDVFASLVFKDPVKLLPGDSATVHIFTAKWDLKKIGPQDFVLTVNSAPVKVAQ